MTALPVERGDGDDIWTAGDRIRKIRQLLGYANDQDGFAKELGVKPSTISKWERDGGGQEKLANVLKISELARAGGLEFASVSWILGVKFLCTFGAVENPTNPGLVQLSLIPPLRHLRSVESSDRA